MLFSVKLEEGTKPDGNESWVLLVIDHSDPLELPEEPAHIRIMPLDPLQAGDQAFLDGGDSRMLFLSRQ